MKNKNLEETKKERKPIWLQIYPLTGDLRQGIGLQG